jgi:hypothetical protein
MHEQGPISLSDDAMTLILRMTAPLVPDDRVALVNALAVLLRAEPQPPGDGAVFRHLRALLRTGHYKRSDALTVSNGRGDARASGLSGLCRGEAIEN